MKTMLCNRRGTAALEFAIVGPLFLILILNVVIYALYFVAQIAIVAAASEGARASIPGISAAERTTLATSTATSVLQGYAPLVIPSRAIVMARAVPANAGLFQVTVAYTVPFSSVLVPLPSTIPSFTATVSTGGY
jgi:Flp pilus assembly protein TadG